MTQKIETVPMQEIEIGDYFIWFNSQKYRGFKVYSVNANSICLQSLKSKDKKNNTVYSYMCLTTSRNAVLISKPNFGGSVWKLVS